LLATITGGLIVFRQLDSSVGESGPRVFAVRVMPLVSQHGRVHRIPPPTSVTIAKRPSDEGGTGDIWHDFGKRAIEESA
jgi:hypothetical protein